MSSRVLLVGVVRVSRHRWAKADALTELAALVKTAGGTVVEKLIQVRSRLEPATLIGKGKAEEIKELCRKYAIDLVVFEDELTPTQLRNLEDIIGVRVIDRAAVILDIFAIHARTAEAKAQVELAQLEYIKTRLTGLGVEMSRLGGGIGTRGPGETKLEVDRRRIEQRITVLRRELARIERERQLQRRRRSSIWQIALVGYTNAGKTTLFNRLTGADAKVSDQLFATLDATTRLFPLHPEFEAVLTDTVGFIRNLPLQLVASFRSTLAEINEADLILHVADVTEPQVESQIDTVKETLTAIGAGEKPTILVFNKIDRAVDETTIFRLKERYPAGVFVSALTGDGVKELKDVIWDYVERRMVVRTFTIPENRWDLVVKIKRSGLLVSERVFDGRRQVKLKGFPAHLGRLRKELKRVLI
ncbi:MAG: GTPase HflX [candidate division WOR-3 bacterium]